ncbi:hypothetical protein CBR_g66773 [Chara braunii]|uniref:GRAM domain-containing protein n=1 Tax=Chara braunii TaxID=69332 RepID=A0A388K9D0_CHABU|nr:hypothetical protein CBR_g66773 [Chara braunii]|eukprot:GBG66637.1 hypothetical protein CBR_g66773 [Chara braunii]
MNNQGSSSNDGHQPPPSYEAVAGGSSGSQVVQGAPLTWQGTAVMGVPAPPDAHPANRHVASGYPGTDVPQKWHNQPMNIQPLPASPYLHPAPGCKQSTVDSLMTTLGKWTKKAETVATDIYKHLSTSGSTATTALTKVEAKTRTLIAGGQESYWRTTFNFQPSEKLRKTFNCYLSTATGPVAGVLYLSDNFLAFCSDKPLPYSPGQGQEAWTYYRVVLPLQRIGTIVPSSNPQNPSEKYMEIAMSDGAKFWFLGVLSFEKCVNAVQESVAIACSGGAQ